MKLNKVALFTLLVNISILPLLSQVSKPPQYKPPDTRILFILDASQSMLGMYKSDRKINVAIKTLSDIVDSLEHLSNVQMALRVYGNQKPVPPQDCNDTRLVVPFAKNNTSKIRQELNFIRPMGTTPIAHSLELGGNDFPPDCDECRNIIILITDGIEACDGDACLVSKNLQRNGIILKPFIIGIGIDEGFHKTFSCVGRFYNAADEEKFSEVMDAVISQALNSTTAQVNLLDLHGNPTETNVNMTFYDYFSGKVMYNFIHTMTNRGVPDTLIIDHMVTYKLRVHTLPPVDLDSVKVFVGKHTVIAVNCPQGELQVQVEGGGQYRGLQYIVRKASEAKTLNMQEIGRKEKYLVGRYELEIPILPRKYVSVKIDQSVTTTVTIPRPGMLNLLKTAQGYGSLYLCKSSKDQEWVCNLDTKVKNETYNLQPGTYRVVFRSQNSKQALNTINKKFEIKSGASVVVQLY